MKKAVVSALAVAVGTFSSVALAAAPTINKYQSRGDTAYANAWNETDCVSAGFDISASEDVTKSGGTSTSTKTIWVSYYSQDRCKGIESSGYAQLPLTVDVNTKSVALAFTLDVQSYKGTWDAQGNYNYAQVGSPSKLSGTVTLTGTGTLENGTNSGSNRSGPYRSSYKWSGQYRPADVALSVKLGDAPLTFQYTSGSLGTYKSGSTEFYRSR